MPVPTDLSDLSTTAASNSPDATDTLATADDYIRALSAILAKVGDGSNALVSPTFTTSVLTGSTTFALFNTTATTVNFAGAATTLNVGAGAAATATLSFTTAINLNSGAIDSNQSTVAILSTPTTVNAFAGASVALNIGNASAAAAFPGGITVAADKTTTLGGDVTFSSYATAPRKMLALTTDADNNEDKFIVGAGTTTSNRYGYMAVARGSTFENGYIRFLTLQTGVETEVFRIGQGAAASITGTLDVSGVYKAGGTSGVASFGPAGVSSITVKNGIITAIS